VPKKVCKDNSQTTAERTSAKTIARKGLILAKNMNEQGVVRQENEEENREVSEEIDTKVTEQMEADHENRSSPTTTTTNMTSQLNLEVIKHSNMEGSETKSEVLIQIETENNNNQTAPE
ncbi:17967_t:CDS:2, partial [Gigaspora margarita]